MVAVRMKRGYGLIEVILTIALGIALLMAVMYMLAVQKRHDIIVSKAQKDAAIWFNFINAVESYAVSSNVKNTSVSCSTLVSANLLSQSACVDVFGNQLAGYVVDQNQVYAYIRNYALQNHYYEYQLNTIGIGNTGSLISFYSSVLDVVSKLGENANGQYDILFTNNSSIYDMEYGVWTSVYDMEHRVWNGTKIPFQVPLDPVENYAPVMRLIIYQFENS